MSTMLDETKDGDDIQEAAATGIKIEYYKERLGLLYQVAEKASSVSQVSKLIEEILSVTQKILQSSASSLFLIDHEESRLYVQAAGGTAAGALKQMRLDLGSGIVGWVATHGTPLLIGDVTSDSRFNKDIDRSTGFVTRSILAAPLVRGHKVIGVLEVLNKVDGSPFNTQDLLVLSGLVQTEALILLVSMAATAITNIKLSQTVLDGYKSTVETLVAAADARDPYAWGHSQRVKQYALLAANALSFAPGRLRVIEFGALLHDIGKIGISESILRKSGPLTFEELHIIHKHPLRGANIVGEIPHLERAREIILGHHERYDGTGYPEGLKGENIPMGARLVAVADAFDTMTTDHSYRPALGVDEAMGELIKGMRTQFCPLAVKAFISGFKKNAEQQAKQEAKEDKENKEAEKRTRKEAETKARREAREATIERVPRPTAEVAGVKAEAKVEAETEAKAEVKAEVKAEAKAEPKTELTLRERVLAELNIVEEDEGVTEDDTRREAEVKETAGAAVEEKSNKTGTGTDSDTYEGQVHLVVPPPANFEQVRQLQQCLKRVDDLRLVMVGGSMDEGALVIVSLQAPMALGKILNEMPMVAAVEKKGKKLVVVMKPSASA